MRERVNNKILALYYRESTREQALNGYNLEDQRKKIEYYAEINKIPGTIMHFKEAGASASSLNRPEMQKLINLIKLKKIGIIIIHNLDRLTRRIKDLIYLLDLFEKYHVELIAVTENIDTATATGRFFIYMISLIAQWEEDTISERSRRGVLESAKEGNYSIGGKTPYGFERKNKKLIVNEEQKFVLQSIFKTIADGETSVYALELARKLDAERKWGKNEIVSLIKNQIYNGKFFIGEETFYIDEKIIDDELFSKANDMINYHSHGKRYNYLFRGLVSCRKCGKLMSLESSVTKSVQLYYVCRNCQIRINEKKLKVLLLADLGNHLPEIKNETVIDDVKKKMNRVQKAQQKLLGNAGVVVNTDDYVDELQKLNEQIVKYARDISDLRKDSNRTIQIYMSTLTDHEIVQLIKKYIVNIFICELNEIEIQYR